jgi:type I restriction enzyme, S subunit
MLSQEQIGDVALCLPPLNEQVEILAFIDNETSKLDGLTMEATHAIDLLEERRTALISAAVTGKIDVRDLVPVEAQAA